MAQQLPKAVTKGTEANDDKWGQMMTLPFMPRSKAYWYTRGKQTKSTRPVCEQFCQVDRTQWTRGVCDVLDHSVGLSVPDFKKYNEGMDRSNHKFKIFYKCIHGVQNKVILWEHQTVCSIPPPLFFLCIPMDKAAAGNTTGVVFVASGESESQWKIKWRRGY